MPYGVRSLAMAALALSLMTTPGSAQGWTGLVPGRTTQTDVEQALGSTGAINGRFHTYQDVLDATSVTISYLDDGRIANVALEPGATMREGDVSALFGTVKQSLGRNGLGGKSVHYPAAGANVDYREDGTVAQIVLRGGVLDNGLTVEGVLRSLIGGRKQ